MYKIEGVSVDSLASYKCFSCVLVAYANLKMNENVEQHATIKFCVKLKKHF